MSWIALRGDLLPSACPSLLRHSLDACRVQQGPGKVGGMRVCMQSTFLCRECCAEVHEPQMCLKALFSDAPRGCSQMQCTRPSYTCRMLEGASRTVHNNAFKCLASSCGFKQAQKSMLPVEAWHDAGICCLVPTANERQCLRSAIRIPRSHSISSSWALAYGSLCSDCCGSTLTP